MGKIVTIHQPDFLPWRGFFDRWGKSDLYIVLDDVQFLRRGWHHRDKIKTKDGVKWLTIPIKKKGKYDQLILEVEIDYSTDWQAKHLKTIEVNYKKAPNFEYYFDKLKSIYVKKHDLLIDLNMDLLIFVAEELGIDTPAVFASSYNVNSNSTERLIELVKAVGGNEYLTGTGSKGYLNEKLFQRKGIRVVWQNYEETFYKQLHEDFVPHLSGLDYLMMKCKND